MKKSKKKWFVVRSIRFNPEKIKQAKKLGLLDKLPDLCRQQLDLLLEVK